MLGGLQPPCRNGSPRVFGLTPLRRRIWFTSALVIATAFSRAQQPPLSRSFSIETIDPCRICLANFACAT
jgi:hypothetical protein